MFTLTQNQVLTGNIFDDSSLNSKNNWFANQKFLDRVTNERTGNKARIFDSSRLKPTFRFRGKVLQKQVLLELDPTLFQTRWAAES